MNGDCDWTDEALFDYVYGTLSEAKTLKLRKHASECRRCRVKINEWRKLIHSGNVTLYQRAALKERIDSHIDKKLHRKKRKRVPFISAALAASIVFLLAVFGLFQLRGGPVTDEYVVRQHEEISESRIVNDPRTDRFRVEPVAHFNQIEGDVWVNDVTNEMLMKVDGLVPIVEKDYQLWLVKINHPLNGELLKIQDGRTIFYYRGSELNDATLIQVSLEQKGGSQKPSGPDTFFVDLNR